MPKIPLFIPQPLADVELAHWFATTQPVKPWIERGASNFFETDVERVVEAQSARAIVLPNNFKTLDAPATSYIQRFADAGEKAGVPVFVFSLGDFTDHLRFDSRVNVFRLSVYRSQMQGRDIVIPTVIEDPPEEQISYRPKTEVPTVSFCGMAALPSTKAWITYALKNMYYDGLALSNPLLRARKMGVYWRRAMMGACRRSRLIHSRFIVRNTFSGSKKTIAVDPVVARKAFVDSIKDADFVLAPKGDGNYSNRFLETLSFGRLPVLLNTDTVLPLEKRISYNEISVQVPMEKVAETPEFIRRFYDAMDESEYRRRQALALQTYRTYLRSDAFFRFFFTNELNNLS